LIQPLVRSTTQRRGCTMIRCPGFGPDTTSTMIPTLATAAWGDAFGFVQHLRKAAWSCRSAGVTMARIAVGVWAQMPVGRGEVRIRSGRWHRPTAAVADSSSVEASPVAEPRGFDGTKKVDGVKCHVLVDSGGVLVAHQAQEMLVRGRPADGELVRHVPPRAPSSQYIQDRVEVFPPPSGRARPPASRMVRDDEPGDTRPGGVGEIGSIPPPVRLVGAR